MTSCTSLKLHSIPFAAVADYRFGGGSSGTLLHPLVAVGMVLAIILILRQPRKNLIAPVLLAIFLIPAGQVIVVAGVHLNVYKIVLLTALGRWSLIRRSCPLNRSFNRMDRLFTLYAFSTLIMFTLQSMEVAALIKALGDLLDMLGGYFVLRFLIQDREDIRQAIKAFALIAVIMAVCMLNEQRTGTNAFGMLGGTMSIPEVRGGSIRSMGAFQHSILAGSFGATLVPLLIWLWSDKKSRKIALFGLLGAFIMTLTCHSSTTVGSCAAGIFGLCMWPLRKQMRIIRIGLSITVIGLHIVMKGPVWSLIEHIDMTGSSESYHRYQLIDTFIKHFSDWWLFGTNKNGSWGWKMMDTSNQYVTCGIIGGLSTLILFIAIISKGFGMIGTARKLVDGNRQDEWLLWCLGATMFAHVVVYFGIGYFDQMQFAWYAFLIMISAAVFDVTHKPALQTEEALAPIHEAHHDLIWEDEEEAELINSDEYMQTLYSSGSHSTDKRRDLSYSLSPDEWADCRSRQI